MQVHVSALWCVKQATILRISHEENKVCVRTVLFKWSIRFLDQFSLSFFSRFTSQLMSPSSSTSYTDVMYDPILCPLEIFLLVNVWSQIAGKSRSLGIAESPHACVSMCVSFTCEKGFGSSSAFINPNTHALHTYLTYTSSRLFVPLHLFFFFPFFLLPLPDSILPHSPAGPGSHILNGKKGKKSESAKRGKRRGKITESHSVSPLTLLAKRRKKKKKGITHAIHPSITSGLLESEIVLSFFHFISFRMEGRGRKIMPESTQTQT